MTIPRNILFNFLILAAMGFSSCSHYYYAPNEGTLLSLNEKNDAKFSIADGSGDDGKSFSMAAGYSPINNLGIQTSYFKLKSSGSRDGIPASGHGYIANLALGTYYNLPIHTRQERTHDRLGMTPGLTLDLYAGYALGEVFNQYNPVNSSQFTFNKKFIQGGFHLQGRLVGVNLVMKVGQLDYSTGIVNGKLEEGLLTELQNIQKYDTYAFREISFRFHFGIRHMRFFFTATGLSSSDMDKVNFMEDAFHAGCIIEIDELFKSRKKEMKAFISKYIFYRCPWFIH